MREVGVLEAKTQLSALLASVERNGAPITITRNGRPIAQLVQAPKPLTRPRLTGPELVQRIKELHERYSDLDAEAREPLDLRKAMGRLD